MISKLRAFILGAVEFRLTCTMCYFNPKLALSYERGREFMHRITFRRFEP